MKETELYNPVKQLLESEGYDVRAEVDDVDISAVNGEELLIVEMKTSFNLKLIMQAVKRQKLTDSVYVAIPRPVSKKKYNRDIKDKEYLLRRLSLGLIYVVVNGKNSYAVIKFKAKPFSVGKGKASKKIKQILSEHGGRSRNYNTGGSVGTKLVTAYKENALQIAYTLNVKGAMKTSELKKAGCSDKTTAILYNNHYGWFDKIGRAEYKISKKGENALFEYGEIVKHIIKD